PPTPSGMARKSPKVTGKYLFGLATKYGMEAREITMGNKVSGVFTRTLLDGLRGGASQRDGKITALSLSTYINKHITDRLSPEVIQQMQDAGITMSPDMAYDQEKAGSFEIAKVPPRKFKVEIQTRPELVGKTLRLVSFDDRFRSTTVKV